MGKKIKIEGVPRALYELKKVDQQQLRQGLEHSNRTGVSLLESLIELQFVSREQAAQALAYQKKVPFVGDSNIPIQPELAKKLPESIAKRMGAMPFKTADNQLLIAVSEWPTHESREQLSFVFGTDYSLAIATKAQISRSLMRLYSTASIQQSERSSNPIGQSRAAAPAIALLVVTSLSLLLWGANYMRFVVLHGGYWGKWTRQYRILMSLFESTLNIRLPTKIVVPAG